MSFEIVDPEQLLAARGFSHGMLAQAGGRLLFVAGQIARRSEEETLPKDFAEQFGRTLDNVLAVVARAGGRPEDIGRLTVYVTDLDAYRRDLRRVGAAYRERMGRHYPAMALVAVSGLVDPEAVVEIEATAVLPPADR